MRLYPSPKLRNSTRLDGEAGVELIRLEPPMPAGGASLYCSTHNILFLAQVDAMGCPLFHSKRTILGLTLVDGGGMPWSRKTLVLRL